MARQQEEKDYQTILDGMFLVIEKCNTEIPMARSSISKAHKIWPENSEGYFVGNIPLRLRLAVLDMATLFVNILTSELEHARNLSARLVCGQLYEFLEDVPKMFGKRYRKHFSQAPKFMKLEDQISVMMRSFNETKTKYHAFLKEIRNNVSSHRDDDGLGQIQMIEEVKPLHIASIFLEITGWYFNHYIPYEIRMMNNAKKMGFGPDLNR